MSLIKNSSILITGVIISNFLAYAFHFAAGRMLGPGDYGVFGALISLFLIMALPASALSSAITKYVSRFNFENEFGKIAVLRKKIQNAVLLFSTLILLIIIVFSKFIARFLNIDSVIPIILIGATLTFALLLPVNRGTLQGMHKFRVLSINMIVEAFSRLALLYVFLNAGYGVNGSILSYGLAYFIAFLLVFPFIKETKEKNTEKLEIKLRPVYKFILLVLIVNVILQSIINVPSLLIKHFSSSEFTGYWTAALNISRISLFITTAISMVMFPEIAREKDTYKQRKTFEKAAWLVILASSAIAVLFFITPQFLIKTLYGAKFTGAVPILEWLGFAMILIGLLQLRIDYFLAKRK